jgi:hypothetical protein
VKLRKLSGIHLKLAGTVRIINRTFSIGLMLYFFVFFCWFCILLFIATRTTTTMIENFHAFVLPRFLLNLTMDGLMFSSLKSANDSAREGKRAKEVLFGMRGECWNENLCKEVRGGRMRGCCGLIFIFGVFQISCFIEQVQFTPTHFTCGLFSFNWKFVFNVSQVEFKYLTHKLNT